MLMQLCWLHLRVSNVNIVVRWSQLRVSNADIGVGHS